MNHHTTITSDQPVTVTIGETDAHAAAVGRLLMVTVRSGLFGQLSMSGQSVYAAILAEASSTRAGELIATARVADLEARSALKTRAVQNGLKELERFGLVERRATGGGATTSVLVLSEPPARVERIQTKVPPHHRAPVHHHAPVHPDAPVHADAPVSRLTRLGIEPSEQNQNDVVDVVSDQGSEDPEHHQKVALLNAAGWSTHPDTRDVQRVARLGTLDQVRSAIARAQELSRRKTMRGSFRGYIVTELERGGYGLFEDPAKSMKLEQATSRRLQALCDNHRRTYRSMPECFRAASPAAEHSWNHLQMGGLLWRKLSAAGQLSEADLKLSDQALWSKVLAACEQLAGGVRC